MALGLPEKALRIITDTLERDALAEDQARRLCAALRDGGLVIAPIEPSEEMVKEAWAPALDEDAAGVWHCMVEVLLREVGEPSGAA